MKNFGNDKIVEESPLLTFSVIEDGNVTGWLIIRSSKIFSHTRGGMRRNADTRIN